MYRPPSIDGKMSTRVIPYLSEGMKEEAVARFLTRAVRHNLHPNVPTKQQASISAVSLRIAGVTEMSAGNVGVHASHARSGHKFDSNQKHYQDDFDPFTSMPAAKCLAGWMNYYANVYMPNMSCLNVSDKVINKLIDHMVPISLADFYTDGRLRPILLASIASLLMYDEDVIRDLKTSDNAVSLALRQAFRESNTVDHRAGSEDPIATLKLWGQIIRKNFRDSNPDFQSLTDSSNSTQIVNGVNHIGTVVVSLQHENQELKAIVTSMSASMEGERTESRLQRRENEHLRKDVATLTKQVNKLLHMYNPQLLPPSPSRGVLDVSMSPSTTTGKRKSPPETVTAAPSNMQNDFIDMTASSHSVSSTAAAVSTAVPTAGVGGKVAKRRGIAKNYNGNDADQEHGGTDLVSIIVEAHKSDHFHPDVRFIPERMRRPHRFSDRAKYEHCLDLFTAVVTGEQKLLLINPHLTLVELNDVACDISNACIERLCQLEGKSRSSSMKSGYACCQTLAILSTSH